MNIRKELIFGLILMICLNFVSALQITETNVKDIVITELGNPALFNLEIKNDGIEDSFEIYTLVSGIEIEPKQNFILKAGETRVIPIQVFFDERILRGKETLSFEYRIAGQKVGVTKDILSVKAYGFDTALMLASEDIKVNQGEAKINLKNKVDYNFESLRIKITTEFSSEVYQTSLAPNEEKILIAKLDQEKMAMATAGSYILSAIIESGNSSGKMMSVFNFQEISDLKSESGTRGILIRKVFTTKTNHGSVSSIASVSIKRDMLSMLFTSTNIIPSETLTNGFVTTMLFEKELQPSEVFYVEVRTNYIILIVLVLLIISCVWIFVYYLVKRKDLLIKKRVALVKTKKGEFALKVTLFLKALKPIKRVSIIDNIPPLVKLYNKFGILKPTRIDARDRRVEWDFEALGKDDERVLSYIIYSRIGVFGEFYLPATTSLYESEGKVYEAKSNQVVLSFDNEEEPKVEQ